MINKIPNDLNVENELTRIKALRTIDSNRTDALNSQKMEPEGNLNNSNKMFILESNRVKISIIVPVFKTEKFLRKCLDSIIVQTLKEIEILVVNSSSPDNSQIIIDEYAKKYPKKIIPLYQKDRGLGDSRNFGLKYARGKYVMFIDSDDTFASPQSCEQLYNFAERNGCDLVIGRMLYDYNGIFKEIFGFENKYKKFYNRTDLRTFPETGFGSAPVMNKIYRRDIIEKYKLQFPRYKLYEDVLFCIKFWYYSKTVGCIDKVVYYYTQRTDPNNPSITQSITIKNFNDRIYAAKAIGKFLTKVKFFDNSGLKYLTWLRKSIAEMPDKITNESDRRKAVRRLRRFSHSYSKIIQKYQNNIKEGTN